MLFHLGLFWSIEIPIVYHRHFSSRLISRGFMCFALGVTGSKASYLLHTKATKIDGTESYRLARRFSDLFPTRSINPCLHFPLGISIFFFFPFLFPFMKSYVPLRQVGRLLRSHSFLCIAWSISRCINDRRRNRAGKRGEFSTNNPPRIQQKTQDTDLGLHTPHI